jgi:hypothetical protein
MTMIEPLAASKFYHLCPGNHGARTCPRGRRGAPPLTPPSPQRTTTTVTSIACASAPRCPRRAAPRRRAATAPSTPLTRA